MTQPLTTGVPDSTGNTQPTNQTQDTTTTTTTLDTTQTALGQDNPAAGNEWYSSLNEEYRNHPSIQKFKDTNGLAKSYLSLESMVGQEKVPVPKSKDDVNAWALYNKAFGVPEAADKYDIKLDGVEAEKLSSLKEMMYKNHIPQDTAQELLNAHIEDFKQYEAAKAQQFNAEAEKTITELKQEWGLKYDENLNNARTFLEKMSASKEEFDYYDSKIGNDPKFIKLLSKMGQSISEGNLGGFEGQAGGFTKTPVEAKQELEKILSDPDDAFWAGARNKRNDMKFCKENKLSYVSEEERKARVNYVNSLMAMQGQS